jgi:hypothetical protein
MKPMKLNFIALLEYLNRAIMGMKDPRLPSNYRLSWGIIKKI